MHALLTKIEQTTQWLAAQWAEIAFVQDIKYLGEKLWQLK
jgi:hypothetical protein